MCNTDQLEAWVWLENSSTVSLVRLEAPPASSVMRENSLLRLVTLPRSFDSETKRSGTVSSGSSLNRTSSRWSKTPEEQKLAKTWPHSLWMKHSCEGLIVPVVIADWEQLLSVSPKYLIYISHCPGGKHRSLCSLGDTSWTQTLSSVPPPVKPEVSTNVNSYMK